MCNGKKVEGLGLRVLNMSQEPSPFPGTDETVDPDPMILGNPHTEPCLV